MIVRQCMNQSKKGRCCGCESKPPSRPDRPDIYCAEHNAMSGVETVRDRPQHMQCMANVMTAVAVCLMADMELEAVLTAGVHRDLIRIELGTSGTHAWWLSWVCDEMTACSELFSGSPRHLEPEEQAVRARYIELKMLANIPKSTAFGHDGDDLVW